MFSAVSVVTVPYFIYDHSIAKSRNNCLVFLFLGKTTMDSKEIYLRDVVILTAVETNKTNLGRALVEGIKSNKFQKDTTFYLICGFHTNEKGEVSKYDHELTKQFEEMITNLRVVSNANKDMRYKFAPKIELKSKETGMHILSL